MDNNQDLNLTIKAKDEATTTLKKVNTELNNVTGSMKKAGESSEKMSTSILKGAAMYDLLRTSVRGAISFLKESMVESMDSARIMAQVETNVKNAGLAYDEIIPKIKAYGDNAIKLGFDDDIAAQSISRLLLVTKDYEQARALANLSMDLASNKNIDLADATKQILLVTQGNTRALREYGIGMDDNATTADVLMEAQNKLKDSTINLSKTSEGQIRTLKQEWNNLKQKVGDELTPTMTEFFTLIQENKETIISFAKGFIFVGEAIGYVAKGLVGFGKMLGVVYANNLANTNKIATGALQLLNKVGLASDEAVEKSREKTKKWNDTTVEAYNNLVEFAGDAPKLNAALDGNSNALKDVKGPAKDASAAIEELKGKYSDLTDALTKVKQTAIDELESLKNSHSENVESAKLKIESLKQSLRELTSEYERSTAEATKAFEEQKKNDRMSIAATIAAQQEKINALQNQYDTEQDPNKKIGLKEQLDKEKAAYESIASLRIDLSNEILAVEQRNSMTDLERAVADYTAKRTQAELEYAERRADAEREYKAKANEIKLEIKQTREKLEEENATYKEKRDQINKYLADAENSRLVTAKLTSQEIIKQIDEEIKKYNELAAAMQRASAGRSTPINLQGLPQHEHGGTVLGPVGTAVPIIAHGGETIIPAGKSKNGNGGMNIVLNMNYPQFTNKENVEIVRAQIEVALRDIIRIYKLQPTL